MLPTKLIEIPDPCNVKKQYKKERKKERNRKMTRKKNKKLVKQSEIITYQ